MSDTELEVDDDDYEIVVVGPGETIQQDVSEEDKTNTVISNDELQRLRAAADDRAMLRDTMAGLSSFTKQQQQPANVAMPLNQETESEYRQRFNRDILDENKAPDLIKEAIAREVGPMAAFYERELGTLQKQLASKDDSTKDIMQKYGDEVEAELAKLPRIQRATSAAYQQAVAAVKSNHFEDIVAERVAQAIAKVRAEFEGQQPQQQQRTVQRKPGGEAGRMAGGSGSGGGMKRKLFMTDDIRQAARKQHMDPEQYLRMKNGL